MENWREKVPHLLTQVESLKFVEKLYILNREFRSSYFENNSYQVVVESSLGDSDKVN